MLPPAFRPLTQPLTPSTTRPYDHLTWLDANRLAPAAAHVLAHEPLPAETRAYLDAAYAQARAQWLLRKTALQRFLALMNQEPSLPVILLKGAALALTLYDDPAIRPMNDIDLLAPPERLMDGVARLRQAGYEESGLAPGSDAGYLHHFIFVDRATGVRFEPHRTLPMLPAGNAGLDWFLNQTERHELEGAPFLTLTPAAQLLHAAAHAVLEHGGEQSAVGVWFYDIDQLLRRWSETLDWDQVLARAQILGWEAALHQAIHLARTWFGSPLPRAIRAWLEFPVDQLSGYNDFRSATSPRRTTSLAVLHIMRGLTWRQRMQQMMHMLLPSRAYMQRRYPGLPWLLAYPYRWFDAARKLH